MLLRLIVLYEVTKDFFLVFFLFLFFIIFFFLFLVKVKGNL